jgi:glycosyltransferase involved in cell wall biosynthesis
MNEIKISYALLTHNEGNYIDQLLSTLVSNKRDEDEIVVVDDNSDDELTKSILSKFSSEIKLFYREMDNEENQKNFVSEKCSGDYVFQLDADETLSESFIQKLPIILNQNNSIDLFIVPRVNIVEGLTEEWIKKWKWQVNEKNWVNFPDWQLRIYRNCEWIKWRGFVHATTFGYRNYAFLPQEEEFSIIHKKELERQISQNNLYEKIEETGRVKYKFDS